MDCLLSVRSCLYVDIVDVRSDSLLQTGLGALQALTFQLFWRRSTLLLQRLLSRLSSTCTPKPILQSTLCLRRLACAESLHKLPSLQASSGSGAMENFSSNKSEVDTEEGSEVDTEADRHLIGPLSGDPLSSPSPVPAAAPSPHPFKFITGFVSPPGSF